MKKDLIFILTLGFILGANAALSRTTKIEDILNG